MLALTDIRGYKMFKLYLHMWHYSHVISLLMHQVGFFLD